MSKRDGEAIQDPNNLESGILDFSFFVQIELIWGKRNAGIKESIPPKKREIHPPTNREKRTQERKDSLRTKQNP